MRQVVPVDVGATGPDLEGRLHQNPGSKLVEGRLKRVAAIEVTRAGSGREQVDWHGRLAEHACPTLLGDLPGRFGGRIEKFAGLGCRSPDRVRKLLERALAPPEAEATEMLGAFEGPLHVPPQAS